MKYNINGIEYNVIIERKSNKNMYLKIKNDLTIYVTTNYLMTDSKIREFIDNNQKWIIRNINRINNKNNKRKANEGKILIYGNLYDITIDSKVKQVMIIDDKIYASSMSKLNQWIDIEREKIYIKHLDIIYNQFEENIPYPTLKIRKMGGDRRITWGNCRKFNKTVTLNSKLIEFTPDKLDYVIVHELSHFIHFDHSTAFWELVSKYCPNYKKISKEMKV